MRRILAAIAVPFWLLGAAHAEPVSANAQQQLTRSAEPGAERPRASLSELAWLVGTWQGEGIGGATAMESWAAPIGGAMPGIFVQTDAKGGTMFSEYMQIAPDGESLTVRLKHFNADLTGWEEKDKVVAFPLVGKSDQAFFFNGLTYQRTGSNRLLVAVRMKNADGSARELVFRFRRKGG